MPLAHPTKSLVILHAVADSAQVAEFGKHLASLESGGLLRVWDGGDIPPGGDREDAIQAALQGADMVAFWVSPDLWDENKDFDFVCNTAGLIPPTAQVVPIIARHATSWGALPFLKQYAANAIPKNQQPMPTGNKEQEDAWMDEVARSIAKKLGLRVPKLVATRPFWKRITPDGRLSAVLTVIGLLVAIVSAYLAYLALGSGNEGKPATSNAAERRPDTGCGFPLHFVQDTLYVLITRFEDYENESGSECYGRGIERRIDQLVQSRKMPVVFRYRDDLSPNQSREADRLRDEFHADLIIWGKLRNAGPDCKADGFCLQFNPSDTLIRYVGGEVRKPKLDDFQQGIAASDIEQGLINMGGERFDDWFVGMFNLKIGKQKPELFVIDEGWDEKKRVQAYLTRGGIWSSLGNHKKSSEDIDRVFKIEPQNAAAYFLRGLSKRDSSRHIEAILDFDQAIKIAPENKLSYFNRGFSKSMLGRHIEAIADYDQTLKIDAKFAPAYYNRGLSNGRLNRYIDAIKDFSQTIKIDSTLAAEAYSNRGFANGNLGRHVEAIADYSEAVKIDPKKDWAYSNRAIAKYYLGQPAEAIVDCNQALKVNPQSAGAYNTRGGIKKDLGLYKEAIADFDKAIEIDPKSSESYYNRAVSKHFLDRYHESIADYDHAIRLDPKLIDAYNNRGSAKHSLGNHTEAIADYNKVLEINSNNTVAYNGRGYARNNLGHYTEAIADYDQAIKLDPKFAFAYNNRGIAKSNLGRHSEGIDDCNKSISLDPKNAEAYYNRSIIKYRNGQYLSALPDYCRATWLDPSKWWVQYLFFVVLGFGLVVFLWKFKPINRFLRRLFTRLTTRKTT